MRSSGGVLLMTALGCSLGEVSMWHLCSVAPETNNSTNSISSSMFSANRALPETAVLLYYTCSGIKLSYVPALRVVQLLARSCVGCGYRWTRKGAFVCWSDQLACLI